MNEKENNEESPKFTITERRSVFLDKENKEISEYERKFPTYIEELQRQISAKDEKLKERLETLKTENEAYRKRLQTEMEKRAESSLMDLFGLLLDVVDNFDRAVETAKAEHSFDELMKGMNMIRDHFLSALEKAGVTPMEMLNAPFDPDLAQAIGIVEVTDPKKNNVVIEEFSKGYKFKEKILRPTMVRVGQLKKK